MHTRIAVALLTFAGAARLSGGVALLVGEPFGKFGAFNPTGHAAVYLSRVCAETPVKLRLCRPGEIGVVISRYHNVGTYDWIAMPVLPYLYAVERPDDVPESVDPSMVSHLRDVYRRLHLRGVAPDGPEGEAPKGNWVQLAGSAYDRNIYGFALDTTIEDDERLIELLNSRPNRERFNLLFRNCADFARGIVNFYYPRALRRSIIADAGISTPKHSAKALMKYGQRHELEISPFLIPQIPGIRPSTKLRGVSESLIRSKKYAVPLAVLQPWVAGTAAAAYLTSGRFNPSRHSPIVCGPASLPVCMSRSD